MHSGIMHYYAATFQNKFKEEVVSLETHKFQIPGQSIKHGLLSLPVTCVYSLLQSDDLKVDDENTVLSFVYHYCRQHGVKACNMLAKTLRFNFLSFHNMISAIRKNEALQHSEVFIDSFEQEYMCRLKMGKAAFSQQLK